MQSQENCKVDSFPQALLEAGLAYLEGGINLIPIDAKKTPADPPLPY